MTSLDTKNQLVTYGVAARAMAGHAASGDLHVVQPFPQGVLIAVVDGLGHGETALAAATLAVATLAEYAHESVVSLLQQCHERLKGTRGVVMSLASFSAQLQAMTWIGVGNVEGLLLRADAHARPSSESLLLRSGVVGYRLPPLRATTLSVTHGDIVILASDGIRSSFIQEMPLGDALGQLSQDRPQDIADRILARYGQDTDDALILVVRYLGAAL